MVQWRTVRAQGPSDVSLRSTHESEKTRSDLRVRTGIVTLQPWGHAPCGTAKRGSGVTDGASCRIMRKTSSSSHSRLRANVSRFS